MIYGKAKSSRTAEHRWRLKGKNKFNNERASSAARVQRWWPTGEPAAAQRKEEDGEKEKSRARSRQRLRDLRHEGTDRCLGVFSPKLITL